MSGDEAKSSHRKRKNDSKSRSKSPRRDRSYDREKRRSPSYEENKDRRTERRSGNRRDYERDSDSRRRSRSPRNKRYSSRNDRRGDKPIIPNRPKLFQKTSDPSTSNNDPNAWSTRIAAVASDDGERSKFEKLLGMHKKPTGDATKPLTSVDETVVKNMKKELTKMEHDLNNQYEQSRAFTHSFRGRGL